MMRGEQYEKEIMKLREEGLSQREIGERLGFRKEQIKEFCRRKREKERKKERRKHIQDTIYHLSCPAHFIYPCDLFPPCP